MRITKYFYLVACSCLLLGACSDSSDSQFSPDAPLPQYDFAAVDERLQEFVDESDDYEGISVTLVDKSQGVVHEKALGEHTLDTVVLLEHTSKIAGASLLVAIDDDSAIEFDLDAPISDYLPWQGVYGDRTTAQLTAGMPDHASSALSPWSIHTHKAGQTL